MDISDNIKLLYDSDTSRAYAILQELEAISEQEDILYPYLDEFISMLKSENSFIRGRGFRLLCKQARWDNNSKIHTAIAEILNTLHDEKPTVVRQTLQYLKYLIPYKKDLHNKIKQAVLSIDCSTFKDTMQPLIMKDIQSLLPLLHTQ